LGQAIYSNTLYLLGLPKICSNLLFLALPVFVEYIKVTCQKKKGLHTNRPLRWSWRLVCLLTYEPGRNGTEFTAREGPLLTSVAQAQRTPRSKPTSATAVLSSSCSRVGDATKTERRRKGILNGTGISSRPSSCQLNSLVSFLPDSVNLVSIEVSSIWGTPALQ
jgi:hypothetical protein